MKHWYCFLLTAFLLFVSPSVTFAQQDFSSLDKWLANNTDQMGGRAVLMIYHDGEIIYNKAVNDMNRRQAWMARQIVRRTGGNTDQDFDARTRIPIASCSKWLSAALVMTFVDEGKLSLSDTVGTYLPVLSQHGKGNITIGECLSHLTAIEVPPIREELRELKDRGTMDEEIEKLALMPMEGEPGTVFHYSNAGLQIAGAVIEKISGKSFETLFRERIAGPLGMTNTDFGHAKSALPAGGARSTAEDYMKFLVMILNRGEYQGKRILSEASIAEMQANRLTPGVKISYSPAEAGNFGYGYGEWIMNASEGDKPPVVTSPGLFGSFPWVDYDHGYCAFLMTLYIKNDGRHERYLDLKSEVDQVVNRQ